jgi:hypothetical protein
VAARRDSDPLSELRKALGERLSVDGRVHLEPLADEYIAALRTASVARAAAAEAPFTTLRGGRVLEHPGHVVADRESRRAVALAKLLGLDRPVEAPAKDTDPYSAFDELGPRRRKRKP